VTFEETPVAGAMVIESDRFDDARGFFGRTFDEAEFRRHGLCDRFVNSSVARNHRAGTVRGMHWQNPPHAEVKLVRCTQGSVLDVCVDLRPASPTYLAHAAVELSAENLRALYVPEGCAHGYQTLSDGAEVLYLISAAYAPHAAGGARFDDPAFGIRWPLAVTAIHERDRTYPDYLRTPRREGS
jgi:dTDP-4-dehydrorhamnose 3,5-epimerase